MRPSDSDLGPWPPISVPYLEKCITASLRMGRHNVLQRRQRLYHKVCKLGNVVAMKVLWRGWRRPNQIEMCVEFVCLLTEAWRK